MVSLDCSFVMYISFFYDNILLLQPNSFWLHTDVCIHVAYVQYSSVIKSSFAINVFWWNLNKEHVQVVARVSAYTAHWINANIVPTTCTYVHCVHVNWNAHQVKFHCFIHCTCTIPTCPLYVYMYTVWLLCKVHVHHYSYNFKN